MTATHPLLIRAILALFLVFTQGRAIAHGVDHFLGDNNPVCATCVAGQNLTAAADGFWMFFSPLSKHCQPNCRRQSPGPLMAGESSNARAPPSFH